MGLFTGIFKVAVDVVKLPVAAVADVATLGKAKAVDQACEDLQEDAEDLLTGGDGGLI